MPVVGNTKADVVMGRGSNFKENRKFATAIREMTENISENTSIDYFLNAQSALMNPEAREAIKDFFVENSVDVNEFADNPEGYADHKEMMEALFENDRDKLLEYAAIGSYNPVMGLVFPLHKNLLMNNIFDKGAINKAVAKTPKFTLSMKIRKLVTPDGEEIDMFTDQDKLYDAIEATAPAVETFVKLPLIPGSPEYTAAMKKITDAVFGGLGPVKGIDNLSIETAVTAIVITDAYGHIGDYTVEEGTGKLKKVETDGTVKNLVLKVSPRRFEPGYGEIDRQMMTKVTATYYTDASTTKTVNVYLSGFMKNNEIMVSCSDSTIGGVLIKSRRDTSNAMLRTCSVRWDAVTNIVEIPNAIPINCPISPEEVKDIKALYNEDQLSNILGMFKTVLGNYKDDRIHHELDQSFLTMPKANKFSETFDFAPPEGYALDFVEWRHKTFMDALDNYATYLIQVLNDPNVTISVIGAPNIIRKITPTEYTYQSPSSIGPVEIDYTRTVVTSDKRVYNFISSDKMRNNQNLIILLNPRNSDRVIYCIYDYQLYLSNEIRNNQMYTLPAVHAFERFKLVAYQPVQGRLRILNQTGMRSRIENSDPIGTNLMNDYTSFIPDMTGSKQVTEYPNNSTVYDTVNTAKAAAEGKAPRKVEPTAID